MSISTYIHTETRFKLSHVILKVPIKLSDELGMKSNQPSFLPAH